MAGSSESCCCGLHHGPTVEETAASDGAESGPRLKSAGHDEANCSLCTLLAKIKVGQAAFTHAEFDVPHAYCETALSDSLISRGFVLSGAPRGPPAA